MRSRRGTAWGLLVEGCCTSGFILPLWLLLGLLFTAACCKRCNTMARYLLCRLTTKTPCYACCVCKPCRVENTQWSKWGLASKSTPVRAKLLGWALHRVDLGWLLLLCTAFPSLRHGGNSQNDETGTGKSPQGVEGKSDCASRTNDKKVCIDLAAGHTR
jgi:hypothetical protein